MSEKRRNRIGELFAVPMTMRDAEVGLVRKASLAIVEIGCGGLLMASVSINIGLVSIGGLFA